MDRLEIETRSCRWTFHCELHEILIRCCFDEKRVNVLGITVYKYALHNRVDPCKGFNVIRVA